MRLSPKIGLLTLGVFIGVSSVSSIPLYAAPLKTLPAVRQLSNMPSAPTALTLINDKLRITGLGTEEHYNYVLAKFKPLDDTQGAEVRTSAVKRQNTADYDVQLVVPDIDNGDYALTLYSSPQRYGTYQAFYTNSIRVTIENGQASFPDSQIYAESSKLYHQYTLSSAMSTPEADPVDQEQIKALALEITKGLTSDYDKALAIHDWVASTVYYDHDAYATKVYESLTASEVLETKRTVCAGYADLYQELMRSLDIPCKTVVGTALTQGVHEDWSAYATDTINHAWNEVYVDGRWVIVDTTWDSPNHYENGKKTIKGRLAHNYFDPTLKVFSMTHRPHIED